MYFWRLVLVYALFENTMACPSNCICKWKGGKQTVECVNKSMITVPDGIDASTQVLDFTGNNLKMLGSEQFERMNLANLQKIYLSRCRLTQLDDRAFKGLANLIELDLSNNILKAIPTATFIDYPSLMKLFLNGNPFATIPAHSFKNLKHLVGLELSRCELKVIEKDAFYGLASLEWLKLDNNGLKNIPGAHTIPRKLHAINLQHNPWYCDCKLQDLYGWLNATAVPQAKEPICDGPLRLRGAPIRLLDEKELACMPDVSPTSLYLEISEGKNVSLVCHVNSVPEAKVSWRFRDSVLQNDSIIAPGVHLYYYLEEGGIEKVSELFIFNANVEDNGTFICQAENQAGTAQSNYTIRIVLKEEPLPYVKKIPIECIIAACAVGAVVLVFALVCIVTCLLRYRVKKRKRKKKEKTKELALYNADGDIRASPITRNGETLVVRGVDASLQKSNGGLYADNGGMLKMPTVAETVGNAAISRVFYPCASLPSEQNPDLINDTGNDNRKLPNNLESLVIRMDTDPFATATATAGRAGLTMVKNNAAGVCDPTTMMADNLAYTTAMSQCQEAARGWTTVGYDTTQQTIPVVNVCYNHFQTRDIHLTPEKFIVDGYPTDYGLPKVPTHFPPILPATAFYRTLPHRRHNQAPNPCNVRYVRDAEFLTHAAQQPASYEHFHSVGGAAANGTASASGDVRYNVEGYPKDSPSYTYTPHVSFSDTVQILGKSSDSSVSSSVTAQTDGSATMNSRIQNNNHHTGTSAADKSQPDAKDSKPPRRVSACAKNLNDSPDEGYVGECPDTTDV